MYEDIVAIIVNGKGISRRVTTIVFALLLILSSLVATGSSRAFADTVIGTINAGGNPYIVAVNPNTNMIYVTNYGYGVSVIDSLNDTMIARILTGSGTAGIDVNSNTNKIYVETDNGLDVIDGLTNKIVTTIHHFYLPQMGGFKANPVTNKVYVAEWGFYDTQGGALQIIDGTTNKIVNTIKTSSPVSDVMINPATNMIYINGLGGHCDCIYVMDGTNNTITSQIPRPHGTNFWALDPTTNKFYISDYSYSSVYVFDTTTNTFTGSIPVGKEPTGVGVNPNTNKIYVANGDDNIVSVVDGSTNKVIQNLTAGSEPIGVGLDPNTNKIYVANYFDSTFTVIEGSIPPPQAIQDLISTVNSMNLPQGIANSLDTKLDAAINFLNSGEDNSAKNQIDTFIHEVNAQSGKKLTTDEANQLVLAAQNIIKSIS